jgi:hypothetical protein
MKSSIPPDQLSAILEPLARANARFAEGYPGESPRRQPVHTVYGGAHLFRADTAQRLGERARAALEEYVPDPHTMADVFGLDPDGSLRARLHERVRHKLATEPVEDFRLDFEDGYGPRPDDEEDACAIAAADETARGYREGTLPPFLGLRIKPLFDETVRRAVRTLDLYVTRLLEGTDGALPEGFVVTLPKIVSVEQVQAGIGALAALERSLGLDDGLLRVELMFETTQSIVGPDGRCAVLELVNACEGRCRGAHFGVYDYTASCSVTAQHQEMRHPACDFARHLMQVSLTGTGVTVSDGATNILPVPLHRAAGEASLTAEQRRANRDAVHAAMRAAYADTRHSLRRAIWQGWDLHPAQLVPRYVAVTSFFLEGLEAASVRLRNFVDQAAQATLVGDVFDDAATGQGLLNFFLRGLACGAITEAEATATGLTIAEIRSRSFLTILDGRRKRK